MSDLALDPQPPALNTAQRLPDAASPRGSMRWSAGNIAWTALAVWALFAPFFIKASVLSIGLFVMAAAVGAIGLSLLTGSTGLLSLGHAFFIAVGAYGYAVLAGPPGAKVIGLGWPPLVAAIAAIGLAAIAGLLVSPIAARLKGIYLGIATFGLVFIGQHLLLNLTPLTGGFDGRSVTPFSLFGFEFSSASSIHVLGVRFGSEELRWYLFLAVLAGAVLIATRLLRGRTGRAWHMVRDSEVAAASMSIDVQSAKRTAFVTASSFAGAAGVLTVLAFDRAVPAYYDLNLSINFLVMITIGGLVSVRGAVLGAAFVVALPLLLVRYSDALPLVAEPGTPGLSATVLSQFIYGIAVVVIVLINRDRLRAFVTRLTRTRAR